MQNIFGYNNSSEIHGLPITFDFLFLFEAPLLSHRNDQSDEEENQEDHQVAPPYHRIAQQIDLQLVTRKELTLENIIGHSMTALMNGSYYDQNRYLGCPQKEIQGGDLEASKLFFLFFK